jgi:Domain of unknown function (DUF4396)
MDPDIVRQQEEEEAASRLRGIVTGRTPPPPPRHDPFVLRAEPRATLKTPPPSHASAPRPRRPPGWGAALQATVYCTLSSVFGLIAGIVLGAQLGLLSWQSLALGVAAGFLLGWRAAVAVLRRHYANRLSRAYRAALVPALIITISLVGGLAIILPFAGASLAEAHSGALMKPWLISLCVGAIVGLVLALPKMLHNIHR